MGMTTPIAKAVNATLPLPVAPVQPVQVGKAATSTPLPAPAVKAATPAAVPVVKAEAISITTGKPVTTDNGATAQKLEAKTSAATPAAVGASSVKPWYADQSKLMKIALVSIVLYFLYKKFVN